MLLWQRPHSFSQDITGVLPQLDFFAQSSIFSFQRLVFFAWHRYFVVAHGFPFAWSLAKILPHS